MAPLTLSIPMPQLTAVLALIGVCLLSGRSRLGLLVGYFACLYWGYIGNMRVLVDAFGGQAIGQFGFVGCGLLLTFLGMYSLLQPKR